MDCATRRRYFFLQVSRLSQLHVQVDKHRECALILKAILEDQEALQNLKDPVPAASPPRGRMTFRYSGFPQNSVLTAD